MACELLLGMQWRHHLGILIYVKTEQTNPTRNGKLYNKVRIR